MCQADWVQYKGGYSNWRQHNPHIKQIFSIIYLKKKKKTPECHARFSSQELEEWGIGDWLAIIKKKGYNDIFLNHVNNIWLQWSDLPELL